MSDVAGTGIVGVQNLTTSGVVGTSGKRIRIYTTDALCSGIGGVTFKNGTDATGTPYAGLSIGAAGYGGQDFGNYGIMFPSGCYASFIANTTFVTISYRQEVA